MVLTDTGFKHIPRIGCRLYDVTTGATLGPRMPSVCAAAGSRLVGIFGRNLGRVDY